MESTWLFDISFVHRKCPYHFQQRRFGSSDRIEEPVFYGVLKCLSCWEQGAQELEVFLCMPKRETEQRSLYRVGVQGPATGGGC